jgi:hypothetical protein
LGQACSVVRAGLETQNGTLQWVEIGFGSSNLFTIVCNTNTPG